MKLDFTEKDCLTSGVAEIIDQERLSKAFQAGEKLRVKFGIDPTSPQIHLGRSIPLWRLRAFQELGHEIHLIIGDYTGQIGDTSDKEAERPMLDEQTVQENLRQYMDQVWMIFNPEKRDQVHVHYNSQWLKPLTLAEVSGMADVFSVNSFIKRELIAKRLEAGSRVSLREMLYPLLQGYDSVQVKADVELGGTDQRFNLLAGRLLQEKFGQPQQAIIMNNLIRGTDGRKMSSSWGNVITLLDTPQDKFGKIMSVHDELIPEYLTVLPLSAQPYSHRELEDRIAAGENPRDLKLLLAKSVVALYHGEEEAERVATAFVEQFTHHQQPEEMEELSVLAGEHDLVTLMAEQGLVPSKSEARRLIAQGGVRLDGQVVGGEQLVKISDPVILQIGKRRFVTLKPAQP